MATRARAAASLSSRAAAEEDEEEEEEAAAAPAEDNGPERRPKRQCKRNTQVFFGELDDDQVARAIEPPARRGVAVGGAARRR